MITKRVEVYYPVNLRSRTVEVRAHGGWLDITQAEYEDLKARLGAWEYPDALHASARIGIVDPDGVVVGHIYTRDEQLRGATA